MMTRLNALLLAFALALALVAPAWADPVTLRLADQKGGARALLEAAGALDDAPYRFVWSEFAAAAPLIEALNAGAVDTGPVGDAPLLFAEAAGAPVKAIAVNRSNAYGTALLAPPNSPLAVGASLKGLRIATGKGSIGHFLVLAALQQAGLTPSDVSFAFLTPSDCKAALAGGAVNAWATWEPYTAMAEVIDHDKVILPGTGLWSGLSYQVASDAAIRTKHAALQDYLDRLRRAQLWADRHPDAYAAALAAAIGMPQEAALRAFQRRHLTWIALDESVRADQQRTADLYWRSGLIPQQLDVETHFDHSFTLDKAVTE